MNARTEQLDYSLLQPLMSDAEGRQRKARKMALVLEHFLGRPLDGALVVDTGCSVGLIAETLAAHGARVVGVDIDRPGLAAAHQRVGDDVSFVCGAADRLPLADASADVVVFNHVYEHVVDAPGAVAELRRIVKPDGVLFLGLGNRLGVMEPHHRLPFLSWLPPSLADRYVRATGRAPAYHERFLTRAGLRRLCRGLIVWDYTLSIAAEPERFDAGDVVPRRLATLPPAMVRAGRGLYPSYVWLATTGSSTPAGSPLRVAPARVPTS